MRIVTVQFFVLISILLIKVYTQDLDAKCDGQTIKYSILANLSEYLENENNIDGREFYNSENLKTKKLGILKDFYFKRDGFNSLIEYDSEEKLIEDLKNYKLDGIIVDSAFANETQMISNDLSCLEKPVQMHSIGFGFQKNNKTLLEQMNNINLPNLQKNQQKWIGIYQNKYINKTLSGENGTLNVALRLKNRVFSYKDEKGEAQGAHVEILYEFARQYGYKLNIIEVDTYDEQIEFLKNKSADIAAGYFVIRDDKKEEIDFSRSFHPGVVIYVVRYENLEESAEWSGFYDSVKQFDGEKFGIFADSAYEELTEKNFPNSEFTYLNDSFELYQDLLLEKIEGFLIDEPIARYFEVLYPERLTHFPDDFLKNDYGFGFQKDDDTLLNEFNDFLSKTNLKEVYDKWNVKDTSDVTIDKNLNTSAPIIIAGFDTELRPLCYKEGEEIKGYEIDLLYKFAKEKNYNVKIIEADVNERMTLPQNKKANITGGWFSITDERKKLISFSNPIHEGATVLATRIDSKKDNITLKILDKNHNKKSNNIAELKVKFPNTIKNSNCIFPEKYNETILINCTISDLNGVDPYKEGFTYNSTEDYMKIVYSNLEINNFLNANSLIKGHNKIITESDKSNVVCHNDKNSTDYAYPPQRKHSGGLSAGGIIAIVLPCVAALIAAVAVAMVCRNKAVIPQPSPNETMRQLPVNI